MVEAFSKLEHSNRRFVTKYHPPPLPGDTKQAGKQQNVQGSNCFSDTEALCVDHAAAAGAGKQDPWCLQLFFKVNRMRTVYFIDF